MNRFMFRAVLAAVLLTASSARAGGIDELPDQGAQALGRGATFTAKADDATALYYNVAGLARQRGTKLQLSANFQFSSMSFQRAGSYPGDPKDPQTPWAGSSFPLVENKQPSFMLPMLVATTDFGTFDRLTFGVGVFGPAAAGRTFQLGINGAPSPARYDWSAGSSIILFPTLGAAYRVTEHLDLGVSASLAVAQIDQYQNSYIDTGCKYAEDRRCDGEAHMKAEGGAIGGTVGLMYRPSESLQLGAQLRTAYDIKAEGTTEVKVAGKAGSPNPAKLALTLPWVVRAGVRYVSMTPTASGAKREAWDIELDATYESWGSAGKIDVETEAAGTKVKFTSDPHWNDTYSVRVGGAYDIALGEAGERGTLVLRAGGFYDSPATEDAYTRIGTNTMAKVAGTAGIGITHGAFTANLAYAAVFSMSRNVTSGAVQLENNVTGEPLDAAGNPLPVINNGEYRAFSHVVSVGIEVNFEALFHQRKPTFGDPTYEDLARPGEPPAPLPVENEEAKKEKDKAQDAVAAREPEPKAAPPSEEPTAKAEPARDGRDADPPRTPRAKPKKKSPRSKRTPQAASR